MSQVQENTPPWRKENASQITHCVKDNSPLTDLQAELEINGVDIYDLVFKLRDGNVKNLGLRVYSGDLYSGNYVGLCRLQYRGGGSVTVNGKEMILKVEPRFEDVTVSRMLNVISTDDEFDSYLTPQLKKDSYETDTTKNELFCFADDEEPIYVKDEHIDEENSSIITASAFLCMLKELCRRPLMGRMVDQEENLVGKVKGRIMISKNIRFNSSRGRNDRMYCRYLRYSVDILENQVLKAALVKAERVLNRYFSTGGTGKNSLKDMAAFCSAMLSKVSYRDIKVQEFSKLRTTGCYAYYKPVINAAKMVINEITLEANGKRKFTGYVVPYAVSMNRLFEMYARTYLKKRAGIITLPYNKEPDGKDRIFMLEYNSEDKILEHENGSSMIYSDYIDGAVKPDIILRRGDKYLVLDVKYKRYIKKRSRDDRLQILAYALMYNCANVGIIFPPDSENNAGKEAVYYEKNRIMTKDADRGVYFNQMIFAVKPELKSDDAGKIGSSKTGENIELEKYISSLF